MMTFSQRRRWNILLLVAVSLLAVLALLKFDAHLYNTYNFTGWSLFAGILVLLGYNLRKKLPFLPLGRSSSWLQFHIYLGLFAAVLYVLHAGVMYPDGILNQLLAVSFYGTALSGLLGLYITRSYPAKLSDHGEYVIFERIPTLRKALLDQSRELVLQSVSETNSTTIAELFNRRLLPFMSGEKNVIAHLLGNDRAMHRLHDAMRNMSRYLNHAEKDILEQLILLVEAKNDLDYQYARQGALKLWLFLHIPFSVVMLILVILHAVVNYAYAGGTP